DPDKHGGEQEGRVGKRVRVEAKAGLSTAPRRNVVAPKVRLMQQLTGDAAVLVIAPWLSPRTRQELEQRHYGYLDLTGNVSFRLARPLVVIRTEGARQDPAPQRPAGRPQLGGPKAGRLVRFLADYRPPYRALDITEATGLSQPYVSRLLDTLENEALIARTAGLSPTSTGPASYGRAPSRWTSWAAAMPSRCL